eukprot:GHVQ01023628.1.p2 GENE.GHVQ01023628.1~~GHVQ01023628.1.p2  ORF type:complete len:400 (+),score=47.43 GHVQ01023628.1:188-1387(+)
MPQSKLEVLLISPLSVSSQLSYVCMLLVMVACPTSRFVNCFSLRSSTLILRSPTFPSTTSEFLLASRHSVVHSIRGIKDGTTFSSLNSFTSPSYSASGGPTYSGQSSVSPGQSPHVYPGTYSGSYSSASYGRGQGAGRYGTGMEPQHYGQQQQQYQQPYQQQAQYLGTAGGSASDYGQMQPQSMARKVAEKTINSVTLLGRVGMDPDIRIIPNGEKVANLSLATSATWRDKVTRELRVRTDWHRVSIYDKFLVDLTEKAIRKGTRLYVSGYLHTRRWVGQDGQEKFSTEVIVPNVKGEIAILDNPEHRRASTGFQSQQRMSPSFPYDHTTATTVTSPDDTAFSGNSSTGGGLDYRSEYRGDSGSSGGLLESAMGMDSRDDTALHLQRDDGKGGDESVGR